MKIEYKIIQKAEFDDCHRKVFAKMLCKQDKVRNNLNSKVDRCKAICITKIDNNEVAIGAIKQKTCSDFSNEKSGLPNRVDEFEWELGYLYTGSAYEGRGIASVMARLLIKDYGTDNLMASTELTANPAMVKILEKNGFRLFGKPWKSKIHDNYLGLFLKFRGHNKKFSNPD